MSDWKLAPPIARGMKPTLARTGVKLTDDQPRKGWQRYDRKHPGYAPNLRRISRGSSAGITTFKGDHTKNPVTIKVETIPAARPLRHPLRDLRKAAGYEMAHVAATLGVEISAVKRWEEGGKPPRTCSPFVDTLARLYRVDRETVADACNRSKAGWR